ncbi:MAG: hypothetical protein Q4B42_00720, partial [Oscillospiraceae bacterium]|nr:hypothetical protein [Oscillospiraceae bacterium]
MKKVLCVLLALLLLFSLAACASDKDDPSLSAAQNGESQTQQDTEQPVSGESEAPASETEDDSDDDELLAFDGPHIEAADYELERLLRLVGYFNFYPEEFAEASELSDAAMFFAAVSYLDSSFLPLDDGYSYTIDVSELAPAVRRLFGSEAALSESWQYGSYEPYLVEGSSIIKYSLGQSLSYYYTYACVSEDGGWELWLLDLYDPLFAEANPGAFDYYESG